jgi:hypothetical protein
VHVIHEVTGVPLKYFPHLAACELAGALGLVLCIWWPSMEVAASIVLVLYFVGATVSHLRISDVKGLGPAVFMLAVTAGALVAHLVFTCLRALDVPSLLSWPRAVTWLGISGAMQAFVRQKHLRRERVSTGKKKVWKYSNP